MYQIVTHRLSAVGSLPLYSGAGFFFNEEAPLRQQDTGDGWVLAAHNLSTRQADARCAIFINDQVAVSPKAAPFGSIEFVESLPDSALNALIDSLEAEVCGWALPALRLINYPHRYAAPQTDRLLQLLHQRQYHVLDRLLNFHLDVTAQPLAARMHPSERRRLAKCERHGLVARQWQQPPVGQVVSFIRRSRQQQGYPLTIEPEQLAYLLAAFPQQYPVFAVWDGSTLASLTVAVRVRHDILYNFLPADNLAYRSYSPAVLLTQGVYAYCQQQGITLLDLGVAVDAQRQPKPGLMRFKQRLGAQESWKLILEKRFTAP